MKSRRYGRNCQFKLVKLLLNVGIARINILILKIHQVKICKMILNILLPPRHNQTLLVLTLTFR